MEQEITRGFAQPGFQYVRSGGWVYAESFSTGVCVSAKGRTAEEASKNLSRLFYKDDN